MLKSISIRNFKRIGEEPLVLDNLEKVNYLVGPNGCGKSSVLECLRLLYIATPDNENVQRGLKNKIRKSDINEEFHFVDKKTRRLLFVDYNLDQLLLEVYSNNKTEVNYVCDNKKYKIKFNRITVNFNPFYIKKNAKIEPFLINFNASETAFDRNQQLLTTTWLQFFNEIDSNKFKGQQAIDSLNKIFNESISADIINSRKLIFNELFKLFNNDFDYFHFLEGKYKLYISKILEQIFKHTTLDSYYKRSSGENIIIMLLISLEYLCKNYPLNLILIEEIESCLHPKWQKALPQLFELLSEIYKIQFIVTTQSPFIISSALSSNNDKSPNKIYHIENGKNITLSNSGISNSDIKIYDLFNSLGIKGSDLLFANCIIWVEGPSDIVYIQKWLEMYQEENSELKKLIKGIDYEFSLYGGALLSYFYANSNESNDREKDLISLLKINPRSFVVLDSDIDVDDGIDKSGWESVKQRVMQELDSIENGRYWFDEKVKTIEFYMKDEERFYKLQANSPIPWDSFNGKIIKDKTDLAYRCIKVWDNNNLKLSDFQPTLFKQIENLYNTIASWNE
ncbi:MAG: hypothetical protein OHK0017_08420 [Patescibacteria group bacterium]